MKVTCTCVRVPVLRSHSISLSVRTKEKISVAAAREAIAKARGCKLVDDLANKQYPMPLDTSDQDLVYVGRIRDDLTDERALALWCARRPDPQGRGHQRRADRGIVAVRRGAAK